MHMSKLAALLISGMLSSAALAAGETMEREKDTTFGTEVGAELRKPTPVEDPGDMRERRDADMERERMGTMTEDDPVDTEQDADFPGSVRPDAGAGAPDR